VAGLVVVDTDLLIDYLRGRGAGVEIVRTLVRSRRLRVTTVTSLELRVGADFLARRDDILSLVRHALPLDLRSSLLAGAVSATLRAAGQEIGFADSLQAGICLRHDLPLATRNRAHFERVEGLQLVDVEPG
jgi:tRNA(fMet)-specific endonuclease VapC